MVGSVRWFGAVEQWRNTQESVTVAPVQETLGRKTVVQNTPVAPALLLARCAAACWAALLHQRHCHA